MKVVDQEETKQILWRMIQDMTAALVDYCEVTGREPKSLCPSIIGGRVFQVLENAQGPNDIPDFTNFTFWGAVQHQTQSLNEQIRRETLV